MQTLWEMAQKRTDDKIYRSVERREVLKFAFNGIGLKAVAV